MKVLLRLAMAVVLMVIVALLVLPWLQFGGAEAPNTYTVRASSPPAQLQERGILVSRRVTPVSTEVSGNIIRIVPSGQRVEQGQEVFAIEDKDSAQWVENNELKLRDLEDKLEDLQIEREFAVLEESNTAARMRHDLYIAELELALAQQDLTTSSRRLAQIGIEQAGLDEQERLEALERERRLFAKELTPEVKVRDAERAYEIATVRRRELELQLQIQEQGTPVDQLQEKRAAAQRLRAKIASAEAQRDRRLDLMDREITSVESDLVAHRSKLERLQERLDQGSVDAPVDGVVVVRRFRDWRNGGVWVANGPGTQRWDGDAILDIIDPSAMEVALTINEFDFPRVAPDSRVAVHVPALDEDFEGVLSHIGGIGRDRADLGATGAESGGSGVTVFNATVRILDGSQQFRPGMSALVTVPLQAPREPRVVVPRHWLVFDEDSARARLSDGSLRQLSWRPAGIDAVEILDGLEPGDQLLPPAVVANGDDA